MIEFESWPKTSRLYSDVIVTEKIDGYNGAIIIEQNEDGFNIGAQSRTRLINTDDDCHGFANWVAHNMFELNKILGPGRHFGEWTTKGLKDPKFFLFNTYRWDVIRTDFGLDCVPVIFEGRFYQELVSDCLNWLETHGSMAYDAPAEGVVCFWKNDQSLKKAFCSGVSKYKGNV